MRNLFFTLAFLLPFLVQAQEVKTYSLPTTFDEVVVTADMVNRYADHKDCILTMSDKQQFPASIQSLFRLTAYIFCDDNCNR